MRSFGTALRLHFLATTMIAFGSGQAFAQSLPLPTGGNVSAGSASIDQQGSAMTVRQASNRAVIDWKSFSIGSGGSVNVVQPGSSSALLNRVSGNDVSTIAGSLTANGLLFLVNRNGILVDPNGKVDAHGGFVGSTLDISNNDFMAGKLAFAGGGTGAIVNRGTISGGAVALLGSRVANLGTIVSPMGRVAIGAGQQATLDLNGDGFLQVAIPSELTDGAPIIDQRGLIDVGGGTVVMRAATAREIVRQTINMAGIIRATNVSRDGGTVVLDGGDGGTVAVSGTIDVSGARGGRVDITGGNVVLSSAKITATGAERGGLVRVGGEFQGGAPSAATATTVKDKFTTRFGPVEALKAAQTTTLDAGSVIDASGGAFGGSIIVWSDEHTRQLGTVIANGGVGGAVELSSKGVLSTDLSRVTPGRGGSLLLDPKNIAVYNGSNFGSGMTAHPITGTVNYTDNAGGDSIFNVSDIKALIDGGTDVTLRASNDINWSADLTTSLAAAPGNLALSAGRSVNLAGYLTLNQSNLSVVANDSLANGVVDADRDIGAGEINAFNATISGSIASGTSGGNLSFAIGTGAGVTNAAAGGIYLSSMAGRSITVNAGSGTVSLFDAGNGTSDASTLNAAQALNLTGAIKAQSANGLILSGRTVNWLTEGSSILSATSPVAMVKFIENGRLTRFGILSGGAAAPGAESGTPTDATRLALGSGGAAPAYSAVYGDAYGPFSALHLVSGSLHGADTLASILASGAVTTTGPAAGLGVGNYDVTTTANSSFGFASGVTGYFVDLTSATDILKITPKALTVSVSGGAYTYGSPVNVASLSGLVGSDTVGLTATVNGLGSQDLVSNGAGYAFAANMAAGQRDFTLTGLTGARASNYALNLSGTIGAALAIGRKSLTYAGTTANSIYGTLNGTLFNLTGVVPGDAVTLGVASVTRNGVTSALTATTNVGTYSTVAGTLGGAAAGNYVLDVANSSAGSAIIAPKTLFYTTSNVASTYGDLAAIGAPVLSGVIAGDDVTATAVLNNGNVALGSRTAAGNYNINAALGGAGAGNYALSSLGNTVGVLSVARRTLGYTIGNASQVYLSPVTLATLTNFIAGDDVHAVGTLDNSFELMTTFANSGVGFERADAGTHIFQLSGIAGAAANNYTLDLSGPRTATLTVTPKPINYTIGSLNTTYASFQFPSLTILEQSAAPLTGSIIATNVATGARTALDSNSRLSVGTYVLTAGNLTGANAGNYMVADGTGHAGSLVITPKPITYSAQSASGTYGNSIFAPGAVLNGIFSADDVSANVSIRSASGSAITLTDRTAAGQYLVTVGGIGGSAAGNYMLTGGTDGLLSIAQRPISYILGSTSTTYGTAANNSWQLNGVLSGDSVSPVIYVNGAPVTNRLNVGSYTTSVGGLSGPQGGNYSIADSGNIGGGLSVNPAPLTYVLPSGTSVYGDPVILPSLTWSGMQFGESAPSATVRLADSQYYLYVNAGTYTPDITARAGSNYYLDIPHSSVGQYIITRRPIGLESFARSTYGNIYGITANQLLSGVRSSGTINNEQLGALFSATAQGVTLSSGGYVNTGNYELKVNAAVGDNVGANYVVGSITTGAYTISPRNLLTAGTGVSQSTYGTLASLTPQVAAPLTGDLASFADLSVANAGGAVQLAPQTAAGNYSIFASRLSGADARNYIYDFSQAVGSLTIAPKQLGYDTGNVTATYGTLASLGTATLSGIVGNDQVTGINTIIGGYGDRSPVGTHQFAAPTLIGASASNYVVSTNGLRGDYNGYLNITPRALSVTYNQAAPSGWIFGTSSPSASSFYTLNNVLSGDSVAATPFATLTSTAAGNPLTLGTSYGLADQLNAGTYRISPFGAAGYGILTGGSASNYVLAPGAATNTAPSFTVTPRMITGSLIVPASFTYGDAPAITLGFGGTLAGATPNYRVIASGTASRDLGAATALPANLQVGTQSLSVVLAGLDSFNYQLASPIFSLISITPKPVSINPLASSSTYGLASAPLFAINGVVPGDDVAPLVSLGGDAAVRATTLPGGFGLPLITRDVGTYVTSIAALTGAAAGNYLLTGFRGSLGITPKPITYTSAGFAAQYGGLTLPTCASGCEMSGRDNGLAYGAVTLNGVLAQDLGSLQPMIYLSLDGRTSAFSYARNTAAGNYLQIVNGLGGSKAGNYVLDANGSRAGLVIILPAWVQASVTGGGRLYTNKRAGTYVSLGTPGIVTLNRSNNLSAAQGGNAFYAGDRVNIVTQLVDSKGNIVDGTSILPVGSYTIDTLALVGPEAANYRLVPEGGSNGSVAGVFTVSDSSVLNFSFLTSSPNGYYVPPAISSPPVAPTTSSTSTSSTSTFASTNYVTGSAGAGAASGASTTQTYADGSSLTASASGTVGATASYTPLSATAIASAGGNVSLIINRGPVSINYGAFVDASGKVEVSLTSLTVTAGGQTMAGVREGFNVGGNLGSGVSGSTGVEAQGFATANGEAKASLNNGLNLGTSDFIGVGASIGANGSLSGGGVTGDIGATLYSPGSLYIGAAVESAYSNHTLTLGLNLGVSLLIGGVEISPKVSFGTGTIEAAGSDFANAWLGLGEKIVGADCDSSCTAARAKIQADYDAQMKTDALNSKVAAAGALMYGYSKPSLKMVQYLQANPDVVHFAQDAAQNGTSTAGTRAITSAVSNYQYLTDYLTSVVSQEKALTARLAANPTSLTAADLVQANYLRSQEKAVVDAAASMFNMRVVVSNGQLTFG